ncbi:MAG: globin domain-containing protein, partial [Pirellulaceae bacterium]
NASLDRCTARPGFLDRFYELFLASSGEVREKFKNTNFERQKEALRMSLYMMMTAHDWSTECDAHLEEIAERHSRHDLDISPHLYDQWLACLLQAVSEFDPIFDADVATAWTRTLQPGIQLMKSRY